MNNKQEKTIRRYVFLATTLLAIASPVTVTGLAVQSQKRFYSKEKNKIEDTDGPDTISGTPRDDQIDAKGGNDEVRGDTTTPGTGDDKIKGGKGNDTFKL
jgi:hypothetical protein